MSEREETERVRAASRLSNESDPTQFNESSLWSDEYILKYFLTRAEHEGSLWKDDEEIELEHVRSSRKLIKLNTGNDT